MNALAGDAGLLVVAHLMAVVMALLVWRDEIWTESWQRGVAAAAWLLVPMAVIGATLYMGQTLRDGIQLAVLGNLVTIGVTGGRPALLMNELWSDEESADYRNQQRAARIVWCLVGALLVAVTAFSGA